MRLGLRLRSVLAVGLMLATAAGCGTTGPSGAPASQGSTVAATEIWPRPADASARAAAAGLRLEVKEHLATHIHAHLDVFVDGVPVLVPAGIGINIDDPEVERFDDPEGISYSGIEECGQPCISPLHTHAESGVLHTESALDALHTLGQFFDEWGVALTATCVGEMCDKPIAVFIDGVAFQGDVRAIELADRREIAIVIGTPPEFVPVTADFDAP
jgi:hypothetical protein